MTVISKGSLPPPVPGLDLANGTTALFFYKVTCPVCQMAAPIVEQLAAGFPDAVAGIGQDPEGKLDQFGAEYGWSFPSTPDEPPYSVSDAYGIRVVPTVVLVHDGEVADVVESWDRDGYNRVAAELAELTGGATAPISEEGDGLPSFRPG